MGKSRSVFLTLTALLFFLQGFPGFAQDPGVLFSEGAELYQQGLFEQALSRFKEAAEGYSRYPDSRDQSAYALLWAGLSVFARGDYPEALPLFEDALLRAEKKAFTDAALTAGIYKAQIYMYMGRYNLAHEQYIKTLDTVRISGFTAYYPSVYQGLGDINLLWGKYPEAEEYYRKGLSFAEDLNYLDNEIALRQALAKSAVLSGRFDEGILQITGLLETPGIEKSGMYPSILNNLGIAYMYQGKSRKALKVYTAALEDADAAGNPHLRAQLMTHIGGIHQTGKNYPEALENYRQALLIMEELGISADQAVILANMGEIYREKKAYTQAAEFFRNSISIKNKLRETASGQDRIDYLASEIKTYHRLVWTLVLEGKPEEGLETAEVSQAKYLTEQLGKGFTGDDSGALEEFRSGLKDNQIYIRHLYSSLPEHLILWADNQGTGAKQLDYHLLQKSVEPELLKRNLKSYERSRGITVEAAPDTDGDTGNMENIDDLIRYYYYLLLDPEENDERYKIGRLLYDYLMAPLDDKLEGKTEIIFALDGLLHFIPLETLITPDGKYVAESFTLSYISSVQAAVMIEKRKKGETGNGILVMGGPDYSAPSVSSVYTELGYTEWPRLPGTLQEAEAIAGLYPGSTLYTGGEITEPRIKEMSGNGELASYRVIHLAAHGLVLTDNPALSALVLSQGRKYSRDEDESDGYLSMAELSDLKIAADFVNLSACETGLGRLYGGEGIVGLTQAVIIAGADSTAASLWQVADESTARFMTGMYRIVQESGVGYKAALARMKRGFIQSDDYRHPFFWAPFVFYGK